MSLSKILRRLWVRVRVVLLAPLILMAGILMGFVLGFLAMMEAINDATNE